MESVNFDRAAEYYDATRALSARAMAELTAILVSELEPAHHQPCLEIGVGTGRIALPLHERRIRLAGADIAEAMLRRLVANADGVLPFPLLRADAARLPLAPGSFGAVLAVHVLHLIPGWRTALDETVRVLRPGGVLLVSFPGGTTAATSRSQRSAASTPWGEVLREATRRHGMARTDLGTRDPDEVAAHLGDRATARMLPPVPVTETRTLRVALHDLEEQIYSWTWSFSRDQVLAAGADVRAWAVRESFPMDEKHQLTNTLQWWAFDLPG